MQYTGQQRPGGFLREAAGKILGKLVETVFVACLRDQVHPTEFSIADGRHRNSGRDGHRHTWVCPQAQARLHLGRQFIGQIQKPAAGKRQARRLFGHPFPAPGRVEGIKEIAFAAIIQPELRIENNRLAREPKQNIEAALRGSGCGALQQIGIAFGIFLLQPRQVDAGRYRFNMEMTLAIATAVDRLTGTSGNQLNCANTSVPFVPPNPNELETATRRCISRASLGT